MPRKTTQSHIRPFRRCYNDRDIPKPACRRTSKKLRNLAARKCPLFWYCHTADLPEMGPRKQPPSFRMERVHVPAAPAFRETLRSRQMTLLERINERIRADEAERICMECGAGWYCELCDDQESTFPTEAEVKHGDLCPLGLLKEAALSLQPST
jgi:hypothetical protein